MALYGVVITGCDPSEAGELADTGAAADSTAVDTTAIAADTAPTTTSDMADPSAQDRLRQLVARARAALGGAAASVGVGSDSAGLAAIDSAPGAPQPASLVGRWYHGDMRSKFGDSLTLVLRDDGTASAEERRYTLDDRAGWRVERVEREGRWEVIHDGGQPVRLCTTWETPKALDSCERMVLTTDSVLSTPILQYAGRHWRHRVSDREEKGGKKGRG